MSIEVLHYPDNYLTRSYIGRKGSNSPQWVVCLPNCLTCIRPIVSGGTFQSPSLLNSPVSVMYVTNIAHSVSIERVAPKMASFLYALTSSNINRSSNFFHCQNQEKFCNNTVIKDPTTSQVRRYTTL